MQNKKGQGLIETLIAVLVVFVGITMLIRLSTNLFTSSQNAEQKNDAMIIANGQMEKFRGFSVLNTTGGYVAYQDIVSGVSSSTVSGVTYTITSTVTTFVNPNYKNVKIVVSWQDSQGTTQSITIVSNIAGVDPATQVS